MKLITVLSVLFLSPFKVLGECPIGFQSFVLDFDKNKFGVDQTAGTLATTVDWPLGTSIVSLDEPNHPAMLFDSDNPTGGDGDLMTNMMLGMILIISEDGDSTDPDDNGNGGTFLFTFDAPVFVDSLLFIDTGDGSRRGGEIRLLGVGVSESFDVPDMIGNNMKERVEVDTMNVDAMEVELNGSGAVGDVAFCLPPPNVFGDPHFVTWSGQYYDYHGICDLLFVESLMHNMTIHIRTTEKWHFAYVSSAAVSINGDIFEFGGHGSVIVNGVDIDETNATEIPPTMGGHQFTVETNNKKTHAYFIDFGDGTGVQIKSYKDMVSVSIRGDHRHFMDSRGLMGAPSGGTKLGRDGQPWMGDDNSFGQEWQVLADEPKLFDTVREPQSPRRCVIPSAAAAKRRRLGASLARSDAEEACADWKMNKEACIEDVLVTGDLDMAAAFHN